MITHAQTRTDTHRHTEALIQSTDRETWQTTSIMASELIGNGGVRKTEAEVRVEVWVKGGSVWGGGAQWGAPSEDISSIYDQVVIFHHVFFLSHRYS